MLDNYSIIKLKYASLEEKNKLLTLKLKEQAILILELQKRPITINNIDNRKTININIKDYVKNSPERVMLETFERYAPQLKLTHILDGGEGYARFLLKAMENRIHIVTKNEARAVVVYLNDGGRVYKDIGLRELIILFSQAIRKPVKDIMNIFIANMNLDMGNQDDIRKRQMYINMIVDMNLAAEGNKPAFASSFVRGITAGTLHSNLIV